MKKPWITILLYTIVFIKVLYADEAINNAIFSNEFNITCLMKAVANDDENAIQIFLKNGSNINEKNIAKVGVIHVAVKNNSYKALRKLLEYNPDLNAQDFEGWTPLMRACLKGDVTSTQILVENNANLLLKNKFKETALILAVNSSCYDCVKIILQKFKTITNDNTEINIKDQINKAINLSFKKQNKAIQDLLKNYEKNNNFFEKKLEKTIDSKILDKNFNKTFGKQNKKTKLIFNAKKIKAKNFNINK